MDVCVGEGERGGEEESVEERNSVHAHDSEQASERVGGKNRE